MKKVSIICDMCGREISKTDKRFEFRYIQEKQSINFRSIWGDPHGPNRERLAMVCVENGIEFVLTFDTNSHFCSEECLTNWITQEIAKITTQTPEDEK